MTEAQQKAIEALRNCKPGCWISTESSPLQKVSARTWNVLRERGLVEMRGQEKETEHLCRGAFGRWTGGAHHEIRTEVFVRLAG